MDINLLNRSFIFIIFSIFQLTNNPSTMKQLIITSLLLFIVSHSAYSQHKNKLLGAWQNEVSVITIVDGFYSYAEFDKASKAFSGTHGGQWRMENKQFVQLVEFNTFSPEKIGSELKMAVSLKGNKLNLGDQTFTRIDNNRPGALAGAWLITGRKRGDEMGEIREGPRKTMKILSGTRFQWIAYNTETKQFMGTGGGTYTSKDGQYVENIDFFSRDNTRVGASLDFKFELKDDNWHHSGKSSKGDPIYEIWSLRKGV